MSFMLFIGPIVGVSIAIIATVATVSVIGGVVGYKDIDEEE